MKTNFNITNSVNTYHTITDFIGERSMQCLFKLQIYIIKRIKSMVKYHLPANTLLILAITVPISTNAEEEYIPGVDIKQVTINGIRLTSREQEIINILGKPDKVTNNGIDEVTGGKSKTFYYEGLEIYLVDQQILSLRCKGSTCITDKGIRPGDDRIKVEQAYGPPSRHVKTDNRLSYTFKNNKSYLFSSLVFYFQNNKVIQIIYHVDYT